MSRLDRFVLYAESHRAAVAAVSAASIALIAWLDALLPESSVGYAYLFPILLSGAALGRGVILCMAVICGCLREVFDPLQDAAAARIGANGFGAFDPSAWAPGSWERVLVSTTGFAMTGFFVVELNRRRRLLAAQVEERREAERQVRALIETSPLAILTLDEQAKVVLANSSAARLLGFEGGELQGVGVDPYLPILPRMLRSRGTGEDIRTHVECRGQRRNGEVFLANVWLSIHRSAAGHSLAAVIWDASENLRDREDADLDSMMATSRVLIGALCHEIRNLASAGAVAHAAMAPPAGAAAEPYQALGAIIGTLEKIACSGLRMSSGREPAVADLGTVLDETRVVIEPVLREAGIAVHWDAAGPLPLVHADHHGLLQVFVNLARNAQQALEGRPRREVAVSAAAENDLVVVRFRDTGPGVAHPEELFRPFQPGAHSSGLGLFVSRAIVRAHGGSLRYSPEAEGSCFAVELWPVEQPEERS
jgi:PAS domain S-box-containing protein